MNPIRDDRTIRALELLNEEIAGLNAALESERLARIAAEKERDAAKAALRQIDEMWAEYGHDPENGISQRFFTDRLILIWRNIRSMLAKSEMAS